MQNYIEKVHIKGFRHFNEMDVTFNPRFNFIVGPNGCGKTSLLRGIILSFSYSNLEDSRYDKEFEIWVDLFLNGLKNRFGGIQSKDIEIKSNYREYPDMRLDAPPNEDDINSLKIPYDVSNDGLYSPLVLGAYRRIEYKRIEGMVREHEVLESRREYLRKAADNLNGGNLPDVKQWLINRYFIIDKEWASIEKENWNWLIANMEYIVPKDWDFKFSRIERGLEPIFNLNGSECYLEELSAGFQSMLSIIFAIFEWIEKTNSGDKSLVKSAEGTVIIDELCAHLHPEWQLVVKDVLCKIFPGLQFIVTTHSPHMIASALAGEVIIMDKDSKILKPTNKSYSGWKTDDILEDIMGVRNLTNKTYNKLINEALDKIEARNIEGLIESIQKLEEVTHSNDTIVESFKIKLAKLNLGD